MHMPGMLNIMEGNTAKCPELTGIQSLHEIRGLQWLQTIMGMLEKLVILAKLIPTNDHLIIIIIIITTRGQHSSVWQ